MPTWNPAAVVDLEISNPVPPQVDLRPYRAAQMLLRLHGRPLGFVPARVDDGRLQVEAMIRDILEFHGGLLAAPLVTRALALGCAPGWPDVRSLLECPPSLLDCRSIEDDIVVVSVDHVDPDPGLAAAARHVFMCDPEVMAVVGLVLPRETVAPLPDAALERRWYRGAHVEFLEPPANAPMVAAFWWPALDALGRVPSSFAGKISALLRAGHTVVYEPAALAWHRNRSAIHPFAEHGAAVPRLASRRVDLADTPRSIADVRDEQALQLSVSWDGRPLGRVDLAHHGAVVSPLRIHDAVSRELAWELLDVRLQLGSAAIRAILTSELARHLLARRDGVARAAGACAASAEPRPAAA